MPSIQTEQVLVVPTSLFHRLGYFQGFLAVEDATDHLEELLSPEHVCYRPRGQMEDDPTFKQLIPYVIFRHGGPRLEETVFQYTRGQGQGEARLHRKRSVGVGGHISSADGDGVAGLHPYDEGMRRELAEEVHVETPCRDQVVGLINDDETEVGRVHLGVVHLCDVETQGVRPRESELIDAGFRPVRKILDHLDSFETWSQISMRALFGP